ncbi:MAG: sulfatase-like hydrolase/transferase [bacterium]|jgi:arylsulfatase A-like enzyme/cytochrome c-type biogenesis protein CcmH/NrfG
MKRFLTPIIIIVAIILVAAITLRLRGPRPVNVLLVSLDTVRPDHLGCYGYDAASTPNVDGVAHEGVIFTEALTSVPVTLPSHTSTLTGLYPLSHGVRVNALYVAPEELTTLAEVLRADGYSTGAFVGSLVLDSRFGLDQGFDVYNDDMEVFRTLGQFEQPERRAGTVTDSACDWLETVEEPFFAFVHYYDAHAPYAPPPPYSTSYAEMPYDGEIAYTDEALGRILKLLKQRGVYDNTTIIITSDHGEGLGEHNEAGHGKLIYDSTVKVALIWRVAGTSGGVSEIQTPAEISVPVELVDLFPTVLELVGAEAADSIDGRSLVPLMRGENLPSKLCYMESLYPYLAYRWAPLRGVRFREWKYTLAPEPELYRIPDDPGELSNVISEFPEIATELKAHLANLLSMEKEPAEMAEPELSYEETRKIRALGYVSASRRPVPVDIEPQGLDPKQMIGPYEHYVRLAVAALDEKDYDTALKNLRAYAEIDPGNPKVHVMLGLALTETGDYSGAEAALLRFAEIDPGNLPDFIGLCGAAMQQGQVAKADFLCRMGIKISPDTPGMLTAMGDVLLQQGLVDSAITVLGQALEKDPGDTFAAVNLGHACLQRGRTEEALRQFHRVLSAHPENLDALNGVASIYVKSASIDSMIKYLERVRSITPDNVDVLKNLGNAYRDKRMLVEAEEAFEQACELEPDKPGTLFRLAVVKAEMGHTQEAIDILRHVLELQPNFKPARNVLRSLGSGN